MSDESSAYLNAALKKMYQVEPVGLSHFCLLRTGKRSKQGGHVMWIYIRHNLSNYYDVGSDR